VYEARVSIRPVLQKDLFVCAEAVLSLCIARLQAPIVSGHYKAKVLHSQTFITPHASLRVSFLARLLSALCLVACFAANHFIVSAQQPNPVEREVTNPLTDTPNVNPIQQNPVIRPRVRPGADGEAGAGDELVVTAERQSASGEGERRIFVYEGNTDVRFGIYRLQADKLTVYEDRQLVVAEGNVVFDQQPGQRITGSRAEFNYATKNGFFLDSTGYTNQTQDGTVINFTASRIEKVSASRIIAYNAEVTACDEEVPKWSFKGKRAVIDTNDRVKVSRPSFRVRGKPIVVLPYASVSLKRRDRASGFLTPTFAGSGQKGFRISNAYYQTLGRSADVTLRNDIYTGRGIGVGADVRTVANSRSFLNFGFFTVKDRIFGGRASAENPDQGGTSFYVDGVQYFKNGFLAAADVNITSSLAFRQVFSDGVQLAISPEERSQVFVNRNFRDYSFNLLARAQVTSIESSRVRIRQLPSISLEKRPSVIERIKRVPLYFSFESSLDGVSRKETPDLSALPGTSIIPALTPDPLNDPLITPSVVQRLDIYPRFSLPLSLGGALKGWTMTATAGARATYYSNSLVPNTRTVTSRNLVRGFGEFEFDVRPPALARNFRRADNSFRFRHTIEPYATYRKISGVQDFNRIVRFDYVDTVADTNEIEFGVTNRFWTRRSASTVGGSTATTTSNATADRSASNSFANSSGDAGGSTNETKEGGRFQPYEALTVSLRAKYFFDTDFGGALVAGRRNQFFPVNTFSGFTYGGAPRRVSPVNLQVRFRPDPRFFTDARLNFDVRDRGGLRDLGLTFGLDRRFIRAYQTFYYTRAINLAPSLARFADAAGNEPGTRQGSQWSPSVIVGNRDSGLFGGFSVFFDFQNRPDVGGSSLRSSTVTAGYNFDCCAVTAQYYRYDFGLRQENNVVFSFRLNGIGTFGTERIGQQTR
jgi:LPS-assembly protein